MDAYYSAIQRLPEQPRTLLEQLSPALAPRVQEVRLRSGRPPVLVLDGQQSPVPGALPLTHMQLQNCFYGLCANSVHSVQWELCRGYFTLPGGHRAGVAGLVSRGENGQVLGLRTVTSIDLRVARNLQVPLPQSVRSALDAGGGLLLAGPPNSGKTTMLRSIAQALSDRARRVTVVDERCELMPCTQQGFAVTPPLYCDVLSGIEKSAAVLMALRSLSPQVILCDEVGGMEDVRALEQGLYAGVDFVASIHGQDLDSLRRRPQFEALRRLGVFRTVVLLADGRTPGTVRQVEPLC